MQCFVDGAEIKGKGLVGAMNFLKKHDVNGGEKLVEVSDFGFLTGAIIVEEGATVPGRNTDGFEREIVRRRMWEGFWRRAWLRRSSGDGSRRSER